MATPRDILYAAYAKSMKNNPGSIATESTELLQLVTRALRGLFSFAARVNPVYFAKKAVVTYATDHWTRPADAEAMLRLETVAGVEVALVPFDDRKAEEGMPSVYALGRNYYPAGNTNDPTGNLNGFYAVKPAAPATLDTALDPMWDETFNELLVLEVAIYLAIKDGGSGRQEELAALIAERDRWVKLFVAGLEHADANERRRFAQMRRINTNTLVPLGQLLAGGSAAA